MPQATILISAEELIHLYLIILNANKIEAKIFFFQFQMNSCKKANYLEIPSK